MPGQVATISTNSVEVGANDQANISVYIDDIVFESAETSMIKMMASRQFPSQLIFAGLKSSLK